MKVLYFAICMLFSVAVSAQTYSLNPETGIAVGLSGGFASNARITGNLSIGTQLEDKLFFGQNHISANLQAFSNASKVGTPVILEGRIGHVFNNTIEIYAGYGYHKIATDAAVTKTIYDEDVVSKSERLVSGFKPAFGIIKRSPDSWWTLSAGVSGNIFSLQLGILAVR